MSREWQPAVTSLVESELDLAGATTHRSAKENDMGIRITEKTIARGRGAVVKHWVLAGLLGFGPLVGLFLINLDDISNHPVLNKALILSACIILAGPAWGFLSGHLNWWLIQRRKNPEQ
jgi:hypothetical protein